MELDLLSGALIRYQSESMAGLQQVWRMASRDNRVVLWMITTAVILFLRTRVASFEHYSSCISIAWSHDACAYWLYNASDFHLQKQSRTYEDQSNPVHNYSWDNMAGIRSLSVSYQNSSSHKATLVICLSTVLLDIITH